MITIIPLRTGTIYCDKGKTLTQGIDTGKMVYIPSISWLIKTPHEKILVDTGMPETETADSKHYPGSFQLPGERIDQALLIHGVKPEEITKVILTHLHWDHCQNGHYFPQAKFYVQKKELEFARNPEGNYFRSYDHPLLGLTPAFENYHLTIIDGDLAICKEVSVILLPGHSPGSQIVMVDASQRYIIAGDAVLCYENLQSHSTTTFILPGRHKDTAETVAGIKKLLSLVNNDSQRIMPGHDEKVFRKKEYC